MAKRRTSKNEHAIQKQGSVTRRGRMGSCLEQTSANNTQGILFPLFLSSIVVIIIIIISVKKMMKEIIFIVITIVTVTISLIIVLLLSVSLLYYYEHVNLLHHVLCVIASGRFTINHYGVRFSGASLFYLRFDIFHDSFIWTIRAY